MIGLGTVGTGVARILAEKREHFRYHAGVDLRLKWIVVRDAAKPRAYEPPGATITTDFDQVLADQDVDIVLELMGGVDLAAQRIAALLNAGKHVVTANKAVLAERGRELFTLARKRERAICFEAAVAGGIPILAAISQCLIPNRVLGLTGILNGTSNFILTAMTDEGLSYGDALRMAQERGFAEADPTLDVDGSDAAQKLSILARLAFHCQVDWSKIRRRGIDRLAPCDIKFAGELGYVIKLLAAARLEKDRVALQVAPTLTPRSAPMGQIRGESNAVLVHGDAVGPIFYSGKGAGALPTASSVLCNVVDLAVGRGQSTFAASRLWEDSPPGPVFDPQTYSKSRFYLRYSIEDRPGALARIAGILGEHGTSIASVIQHETGEDSIGSTVPLIIMTHLADERAVLDALEKTNRLEIIREPTVFLHVVDG